MVGHPRFFSRIWQHCNKRIAEEERKGFSSGNWSWCCVLMVFFPSPPPPPSHIWPLLMGKWDEDGMANLLLIHSSQKAKKTIIRARTHTALSHTTVSAKAQKSGLLGRPLFLEENCSLEAEASVDSLHNFPPKIYRPIFFGKGFSGNEKCFSCVVHPSEICLSASKKNRMGKEKGNREKGVEKGNGSQKSH